MSLQELYNRSDLLLNNASNNAPVATLMFGLVTSLLRSKEPKSSNINGEHYDFIIVGAGSAGCVVANRLSENPHWKVLLIEGGPPENAINDVPAYKSFSQTEDSTVVWPRWTQPEPRTCGGQPCFWPGGKVMGGTSTINTLIYARGFKGDYDKWSRWGNHGWDWKDVLCYFKKSENNLDPKYAKDTEYHSTGGYLGIQTFPYHDENTYKVLDAYKELGYSNTDYNGPHPTGIFLMQGTVKNGVRQSSNRAFIDPIKDRKNLVIANGVVVTKVIIDPETKTAQGVEYVMDNDHSTSGKAFARKEIVLSTGTMESPRILMLSGIGPKKTLEKLGINVIQDLKVGRNLKNHPTGVGVTLNLRKSSTMPKNKEQWLQDITQYVNNQTGPLSATGVSQLSGYIPSSFATDDYPDMKFGFSFSDVDTQAADIPASYYSKIGIGVYCVRPRSVGHVTINSTDPFSPILIYPNLISNPIDRDILVQGHVFALDLARTKTFADSGIILDTTKVKGCEGETFGTYEYYNCTLDQFVGSAHHMAGTCKMGPSSDPDAVVDPELRVHGVKHLRVIDASIAPDVPSANTNAPAMMIGEKGSDLIKQSHNYRRGKFRCNGALY